MIARVVLAAPALALALVLAGCAARFRIDRADVPALVAQAGASRVSLDRDRALTGAGTLRFERGGRRSPPVVARLVVVDATGVCFPSKFRGARNLDGGLRVDRVDPRIAADVMRPLGVAVRVAPDGDTWRVDGGPVALRAWIRAHLAVLEDAKRRFVDLPHPRYTTRAPDGWTAVDLLWANTSDGDAYDIRAYRTSWVGWRWDELDGASYHGGDYGRDRSDDWLAWDLGEETTWMVHRGGGLVPGRCPIAGTPRRLFAPAP